MPVAVDGGRSNLLRPTITFVDDTPARAPRIDLNKADAKSLTRLPGIGEVTARRIIEARESRTIRTAEDLAVTGVISNRVLGDISNLVGTDRARTPLLTEISTDPPRAIYEKPFRLLVAFDDSSSGVSLVRLQAESVSHSLDLVREVSEDQRRKWQVIFDMPAMAAGVLNVQVSVYDAAGNKDYMARTLHVFHNPASVIFYPSERSLRIARGAAQKKSDGKFHCNSNFYFYNGTGSRVTLRRAHVGKDLPDFAEHGRGLRYHLDVNLHGQHQKVAFMRDIGSRYSIAAVLVRS